MDEKWFKARLAEQGNTQASLARRLGRDRSQVNVMLKKKKPRGIKAHELSTIAHELGVSIPDLLKQLGFWELPASASEEEV